MVTDQHWAMGMQIHCQIAPGNDDRYISLIYIGYFQSKISDIFYIFDIYDFYGVFCDTVRRRMMPTVCVFCWLMTCAFSIFSVLDNFCQITSPHSNAVWMTRVLHLICNAHIHIVLFGIKFYILAMYVQMLDIYRKYQKNLIFSDIFDILIVVVVVVVHIVMHCVIMSIAVTI